MEHKAEMPLSDQVALAVGHVVIDFNRLEVDVADLIQAMIDETDTRKTDAICAQLKFLDKLDLAAALFNAYSDDEGEKSKLKGILNRAEQINDARNRIIHSEFWLNGLDPKDLYYTSRKPNIRGRKGFRADHQKFDSLAMNELCERMADVGAELYHFRRDRDWDRWKPDAEE